jgi:hypothetical protein
VENPTSDQLHALDKLIGRKIWDIEIIEENDETIVRIFFSENEDDFILIYAQYMEMSIVTPKPTQLH